MQNTTNRVPPTFTDELRAALAPYGRTRRLPGGLRYIDIDKPHLVDVQTCELVNDTVLPLMERFHGEATAAYLHSFGSRFAIMDRVAIAFDPSDRAICAYLSYTVLGVNRSPVVWIHNVTTCVGRQSARVAPVLLGRLLITEWRRHRFPAAGYVTGLTVNSQLTRFGKGMLGDGFMYPRADGEQPADVRVVADTIGQRIVMSLHLKGDSSTASFNPDTQMLHSAVPGEALERDVRDVGTSDYPLVIAKIDRHNAGAAVAKLPRLVRQRRQAATRRNRAIKAR